MIIFLFNYNKLRLSTLRFFKFFISCSQVITTLSDKLQRLTK
jgi:hypothetical protein